MNLAQVAYEAWNDHWKREIGRGESTAGVDRPWTKLPKRQQAAWQSAAFAVERAVVVKMKTGAR